MSLRKYFERAEWIWLDSSRWPEAQTGRCTTFGEPDNFAAASFYREFEVPDSSRVRIRVSADCKYILRLDGKILSRGPAAAGGDYGNAKPLGYTFFDELYAELPVGIHCVRAEVFLVPDVMAEYSEGRGGFLFEASAEGKLLCATDEHWYGWKNAAYPARFHYCPALNLPEKIAAKCTGDSRILLPSGLLPLTVERIFAPASVSVGGPNSSKTLLDFGRTYSCYLHAEVECSLSEDSEDTAFQKDAPDLFFACYERKEDALTSREEHVALCPGKWSWDSAVLASVRFVYIMAPAFPGNAKVRLELRFTHYPAEDRGRFWCSDPLLNRIRETSRRTLLLCMQTYHLDSPVHQEALGCTGDYRVESLMNYYSFGESELTRLDLVRTAKWLELSGGNMFHISYSLIWVLWVRDYLRYTGDGSVCAEILPALHILFERFAGWTDRDGLLSPPNYMFLDWVPVEEWNLHHPPKVLGQGAMTAFYFAALNAAAELETYAGGSRAQTYRTAAESVRRNFEKLWRPARGLYASGLPESDPCAVLEEKAFMPSSFDPAAWCPAGEGEWFQVHVNALAVVFGLAPQERFAGIMEKAITDETLIPVQPYFMHYVFDALDRAGLFEKYGNSQLRRWKVMLDECEWSLKEIWTDGGFPCDHSHAWGGTPVYQLGARVLGVKPVSDGWTETEISPCLGDLDWAIGDIPLPKGEILHVSVRKGAVGLEIRSRRAESVSGGIRFDFEGTPCTLLYPEPGRECKDSFLVQFSSKDETKRAALRRLIEEEFGTSPIFI